MRLRLVPGQTSPLNGGAEPCNQHDWQGSAWEEQGPRAKEGASITRSVPS
jgi:hypothetical protein